MPEGPSIYIAREEMQKAIGEKVLKVKGNSKMPISELKGQELVDIGMWGKHLLLFFSNDIIKIHFMLFGSYSIDTPKENRIVRMSLAFKKIKIFFYACSVQFLERDPDEIYDWSADVMSFSWDPQAAIRKIIKNPNEMVCDILMDQSIFSGVGNIIKNEVLFNLLLRPQRLIKSLPDKMVKDLVEETHVYTWNFYEWKKAYELKKHWQIMRKKKCPLCSGPVTREPTGKKQRLSHYCKRCQK